MWGSGPQEGTLPTTPAPPLWMVNQGCEEQLWAERAFPPSPLSFLPLSGSPPNPSLATVIGKGLGPRPGPKSHFHLSLPVGPQTSPLSSDSVWSSGKWGQCHPLPPHVGGASSEGIRLESLGAAVLAHKVLACGDSRTAPGSYMENGPTAQKGKLNLRGAGLVKVVTLGGRVGRTPKFLLLPVSL